MENTTPIPNKIIDDQTISNPAKMLYIILARLSWIGGKQSSIEISNAYLSNALNCSKDAFYKYSKELTNKKYINKEQLKDEKSRFSNSVYKILQ